MKVSPMAGNAEMSTVETVLKPSLDAMLDELAWWAYATRQARAASTDKAKAA
jgi:hypothetical protein